MSSTAIMDASRLARLRAARAGGPSTQSGVLDPSLADSQFAQEYHCFSCGGDGNDFSPGQNEKLGGPRCPSCGTFISTTSMLPGRPSLNCFVCGVDLPPGTPYTRKIACTSDKQVGASSRPTTDCFHTDGESRRPFPIDDDTKGAKCDDCQNTAIFDLSGQGVEEFYSCQECFFIPRADVVRAGATFIQQSNLRVRSITTYRSPSSGGGSPQGVRSLLSATPHPRTSSTSSPKGAGAANAAGNVSVPSSFAKAPGSSRAGKGKRPRVE